MRLDNRVLHFLWIGINPLVSLWRQRLLLDSSSETLMETLEEVSRLIDLQIDQIAEQVTALMQDPKVIRFVKIS